MTTTIKNPPNWWDRISLVRRRRILNRIIHRLGMEISDLIQQRKQFEIELAVVEAELEASK